MQQNLMPQSSIPQAMAIVVNGEPRSVDRGATVAVLLMVLELSGRPLAVEVNGEVSPRAEHDRRVSPRAFDHVVDVRRQV